MPCLCPSAHVASQCAHHAGTMRQARNMLCETTLIVKSVAFFRRRRSNSVTSKAKTMNWKAAVHRKHDTCVQILLCFSHILYQHERRGMSNEHAWHPPCAQCLVMLVARKTYLASVYSLHSVSSQCSEHATCADICCVYLSRLDVLHRVPSSILARFLSVFTQACQNVL
jgi:hypothetical protein